MNKKEARLFGKQVRAGLSKEEISFRSAKIVEGFLDLPQYQEAEEILLYASAKGEVDTVALLHRCLQDGKKVALPKVLGERSMAFFYVADLCELVPGVFQIPEPVGTVECVPTKHSLMVIPGVAFDEKCHRVGYGGGYYDTYLEQHRDVFKIALAYEAQVVEEIETETYDIQPELLVTEEKVRAADMY